MALVGDKELRIIATIEARMGSSRLPGKTLIDIEGKPLLERVIDRIKLCRRINDIVVATSINPLDDKLAEFVKALGIQCYRGSEDDVLQRVTRAAEHMRADITVQFGGDSPFIDWQLVDDLIKHYLENQDADLVTNCLELTYPLGVYTFVVPLKALKIIDKLANTKREREDVTRYLWEHPEQFKLINLRAPGHLCHPDLRLTLDYPEDLLLTRKIYAQVVSQKPDFTTADVINFLKNNPELKNINSGVVQNSAPHIKAIEAR